MKKTVSIAIDGPAGAGKSTLAKALSEKLGFIYVDTGALYRAIGLYAFHNNISPKDEITLGEHLKNITISLSWINGKQHVFLNGTDVNDEIRLPIMSLYASNVSAMTTIRNFLIDTQRNMAKEHNVVMDGRDIGTVILPNADVKIFMTAKTETRAKRRFKELIEKGKEVTYEDVYSDMLKRDKNDCEREIAPCIPAKDAYYFDNSEYNFEESVLECVRIVERKIHEAV